MSHCRFFFSAFIRQQAARIQTCRPILYRGSSAAGFSSARNQAPKAAVTIRFSPLWTMPITGVWEERAG